MSNGFGRLALRLVLLTTLAMGTQPEASAQPEAGDRRNGSSADAAAPAARDARAELEEAQRQLEAAQQRVQEKARAAEEAEAAAEAASSDPAASAEEAMQRAAEAERQARAAERKARQALERVEALEGRFAYDRRGLYFGGSAFYALEDLDLPDDLRADNTVGASGHVGYRLHSHVAIEARFDYLDRLEIEGTIPDAIGAGEQSAEFDLDAYSVTGNLRVFILPWRVQPWLGVGAGAIWSDLEGRDKDTGERIETLGRETDPLFRVSGGVDLYLTPHFVLNLEAAYNTAAGDRDHIRFGTLGAGLAFRF